MLDDASGGAAEPAAAASDGAADQGLWGGTESNRAAPDRDAPGHGMWTESDSIRDRGEPGHQHGGSIRARPWGPVPGLREPTGWRRGIRTVTRRG